MFKPGLRIGIIAVIIFGLFSLVFAQQERVTITTYYPSPYGVYRLLRLFPAPRPATCQEGELYFHDGSGGIARGLYYCNQFSRWVQALGFWAATPSDPNNIYNTNTGNVGIGTNSPFARLDVSGTTLLGIDNSGGDLTDRLGERCRIRMDRGYGSPGVPNTLLIEHTEDDRESSGAIVLGFAVSPNDNTSPTSSNWATQSVPGIAIRETIGAATRIPVVGIGMMPQNSARMEIMPTILPEMLFTVPEGEGDANVEIYGNSGSQMLIGTTNKASLGFVTNNTRRMTISSDGKVVDIQDGNVRLDADRNYGIIWQNDANGNGMSIVSPTQMELRIQTVGDGARTVATFQRNTGNVGIGTETPSHTLTVNGTAWCSSLWQSSDLRWKENIASLANPLEKISRLRGVEFDWKRSEFKEHHFPEGRQIGIIAQELEKEFPELVTTDGSGYKAIAYDRLAAVLLEAIKEQQKEIEGLKAEIHSLKSKL